MKKLFLLLVTLGVVTPISAMSREPSKRQRERVDYRKMEEGGDDDDWPSKRARMATRKNKEQNVFPCIPCRKTFEDKYLWKQHIATRKHQRNVANAYRLMTTPILPMDVNSDTIDSFSSSGYSTPANTSSDTSNETVYVLSEEEVEDIINSLESDTSNETVYVLSEEEVEDMINF